jgi:dTDP-4-dehydrorhamnose 3,5-epimerase-like enzyme
MSKGAVESLGEDPSVKPLKVARVKVLRMPEVKESRGCLSYAELGNELPFTPKRYFVVYDVPPGEVRGGHAHRSVHQLLVCVKGCCTVTVDDGNERDEILLDSPAVALYIPPCVWATQQKYSPGAVLLVLASDLYNTDEYIRDYQEFLKAARSE